MFLEAVHATVLVLQSLIGHHTCQTSSTPAAHTGSGEERSQTLLNQCGGRLQRRRKSGSLLLRSLGIRFGSGLVSHDVYLCTALSVGNCWTILLSAARALLSLSLRPVTASVWAPRADFNSCSVCVCMGRGCRTTIEGDNKSTTARHKIGCTGCVSLIQHARIGHMRAALKHYVGLQCINYDPLVQPFSNFVQPLSSR